MNNSICNFMPSKSYTGGVKPIHFVYETDFHSLRQPFFHACFSVFLVTKGCATLHYANDFPLRTGDLFFAFPSCRYTLEASNDFEYMYISFLGDGSYTLLQELGISETNPVYNGFEHLIEFWQQAIRRRSDINVSLLTEGLLLYTLSFISPKANTTKAVSGRSFERIVEYVDQHFHDTDLSLSKLSEEFSYTEKYVSSLFTKYMNVTFKQYLNTLRIQHAYKLIEQGETSVSYIAEQCGYADAVYFTKVFKTKRQITPTEYIRQQKN